MFRFPFRCGCLSAWIVTSALCLAREPELSGVFPGCVRQGGSVELTLEGPALDAGAELFFTREGLSAEPIGANRFRITADVETTLGDCDLWVAAGNGLCGPQRFSVVPCEVGLETEPNDTAVEAQPVDLPIAIHARLDKSADLDWFTFAAERGQPLTISCRSPSIDGSAQPVFTLVDPDGREVLHSQAGTIEPAHAIKLAASGNYRLLVHDRAYQGDKASVYRVELNTGSVHDPRAGACVRPSDLFAGDLIGELPGNSRQAPQSVELPSRIAGCFAEEHDVDWYRFSARKDEVIHIEAFGERLRQLMDLEAAIFNSQGEMITVLKEIPAPKGAPGSLPLASLDPAIDWQAPADGVYDLAIRDLYGGSVFGQERGYELVIERRQPGFFALAVTGQESPGRGTFLEPGGTKSVLVVVLRTGGFSGPVTIRAVDRVQGIEIEPCRVEGNEVARSLEIVASDAAPTGFHRLRLVAEAEIGSDKRAIAVGDCAVIRGGVTRRIDSTVIFVSK